MTLGRLLYSLGSRALGLALPLILNRRAAAEKEDRGRLNERHARTPPPRPAGRLVWIHGASVGESQVSLALARELLERYGDLHILLTSQTLTSARMLTPRLNDHMTHQMAPIDTPAIARRFVDHWRPDLCVFVEGEIWPNLIREANAAGAKLALVNGRMTEKTLKTWARWPATARAVFGSFDVLLAADTATADGLNALLPGAAQVSGNIKTAIATDGVDATQVAELKAGFSDRLILLAASTHPGEDELFLDAVAALPLDAALIIAPRHPKRADAIEMLCQGKGFKVARRSRGDAVADCDVLLADTIGEMALWYALADTVFLGGASVDGIGGHNPMEAVQFGHRIVTGPHGFNAREMFAPLEAGGILSIAGSSQEIASGLARHLDMAAPDHGSPALIELSRKAHAPLDATLDELDGLLTRNLAS